MLDTVVQWVGLTNLGVIALLGFLFKASLLSLVDATKLKDKAYFHLLFYIMLINLVESAGYFVYERNPRWSEWLVDIYMILLYFIAASLIVVLANRFVERKTDNYVYGFACALSVAHISGLLVQGYSFQGFALVRIPAQFQIVSDLFLIAGGLCGCLLPLFPLSFKRSDVALFSYSLVLTLVITLQVFDIKATTGLFLAGISMFLTYYLFVDAKNERCFRLQSRLFRTVEFLKLAQHDDRDFAQASNAAKRIEVDAAMIRTKGSKIMAATMLNTSPATISRHATPKQNKNN